MADHSHHESKSRTRTPFTRAFRKIVDAVEDVVDGVVERTEGVERDGRKLVENLLKEREEHEEKKPRAEGASGSST